MKSAAACPRPSFAALLLGAAAATWPACSPSGPGLEVVAEDGVDLPLREATAAEITTFLDGDAVFGLPFRPSDGLGPFYIRSSCESCHAEAVRGPGLVQKMVVVSSDGVTPADDQSALAYGNTVRPLVTASGTAPLRPPTSGWPVGTELKVTIRMPPPLLGRGYLEAIEDAEIERVEREQAARADAIHGRINRVAYRSQPNPDLAFHQHTFGQASLIGRFGLKARLATLDDFAADAFQGDMGVTSPLRPGELPNPAGLDDDDRPGPDVDAHTVNLVTTYMRFIEIPRRDPAVATDRARAAFAEARCAACHVPAMRTRADYPIAELAGIDAPVYSDLLLHDMGPGFADGLADESARSTQWRTAPLIGLRFMRSYLHDGRARTVEDAVRLHGGPGSEAADSAARFDALPAADRAALIAFVRSL